MKKCISLPVTQRIIFFLVLGLYSFQQALAQEEMVRYKEHVKLADSLYDMKKFKESADNYFTAFEFLQGKAYPLDRYNTACSYALSEQPDSAFKHLRSLALKANYTNLSHIPKDSDLNSLHADARWTEIIDLVTANKAEQEKDYNMPTVKLLDSIYEEDQGIRRKY